MKFIRFLFLLFWLDYYLRRQLDMKTKIFNKRIKIIKYNLLLKYSIICINIILIFSSNNTIIL